MMRLLSHFLSVLLLALSASLAAAQVTAPVHEVDLVPGGDLGFMVKFKKDDRAIPMLLYINSANPMSTLPEQLLIDLGATKIDGEVTWTIANGTLVTLPIYRAGPIFIGTCRIGTTYFVGNPYNLGWVGKNLLEYLDYYGFLLSKNKMVFSCPQET